MNQVLLDAQSVLRNRLFGKETKCRQDIEKFQQDLKDLITRSVEYGESNSLLVIGSKGSGKTTLLKTTVDLLQKKLSKTLIIVRLNGYMQTDDRIALAEITRQLHLENTLGDKVFGSFSETLQFLLEALRGGSSHSSQPILFILEEFDLFTQHKNQTLLYNLFDLAMAGLTPLVVVGLTCRLDVIELMEKRVKSRFSHRQLYICNQWTAENYLQAFSNMLLLDAGFCKTAKHKSFLERWNANVVELSNNASVQDILKRQFSISKEMPSLQCLLVQPICKLNVNHQFITAADIADSARNVFSDPKANILHGVSVLELCLIIAMNHLTNIYAGESFNFHMVYNEFLKFTQKKLHILQKHNKPVVLKAFEHLMELELIKPKESTLSLASKLLKEYQPTILLLEEQQLKEAVYRYPGCPTELQQWLESSTV
uniref:Origin recognition complex subunit 4 n=1 Tax=Ciona intestinalis TaxID=7719 RepID=F7B503_CIOIN|nr:origin recognition complex subunit 4 [Ciona intestinalis]|eukprot:XP_002121287.2 origin recognition complex subunit 4 [Ciona intestinalis]